MRRHQPTPITSEEVRAPKLPALNASRYTQSRAQAQNTRTHACPTLPPITRTLHVAPRRASDRCDSKPRPDPALPQHRARRYTAPEPAPAHCRPIRGAFTPASLPMSPSQNVKSCGGSETEGNPSAPSCAGLSPSEAFGLSTDGAVAVAASHPGPGLTVKAPTDMRTSAATGPNRYESVAEGYDCGLFPTADEHRHLARPPSNPYLPSGYDWNDVVATTPSTTTPHNPTPPKNADDSSVTPRINGPTAASQDGTQSVASRCDTVERNTNQPQHGGRDTVTPEDSPSATKVGYSAASRNSVAADTNSTLDPSSVWEPIDSSLFKRLTTCPAPPAPITPVLPAHRPLLCCDDDGRDAESKHECEWQKLCPTLTDSKTRSVRAPSSHGVTASVLPWFPSAPDASRDVVPFPDAPQPHTAVTVAAEMETDTPHTTCARRVAPQGPRAQQTTYIPFTLTAPPPSPQPHLEGPPSSESDAVPAVDFRALHGWCLTDAQWVPSPQNSNTFEM